MPDPHQGAQSAAAEFLRLRAQSHQTVKRLYQARQRMWQAVDEARLRLEQARKDLEQVRQKHPPPGADL